LEAPAEAAGTTIACPYCQHPEKVPQKVEAATNPGTPMPADPLPAAATAITTTEQVPLLLTAYPDHTGADSDRQSKEKLGAAAGPDASVAKPKRRFPHRGVIAAEVSSECPEFLLNIDIGASGV
jgi:hypothetical protein